MLAPFPGQVNTLQYLWPILCTQPKVSQPRDWKPRDRSRRDPSCASGKCFPRLPFHGNLRHDMAKTPETSQRPFERNDHNAKKRPINPLVDLVEGKSDAVHGKKIECLNSLEVAEH